MFWLSFLFGFWIECLVGWWFGIAYFTWRFILNLGFCCSVGWVACWVFVGGVCWVLVCFEFGFVLVFYCVYCYRDLVGFAG